MKKRLYELFIAFGDVIDVVHMRTPKMRGQVMFSGFRVLE